MTAAVSRWRAAWAVYGDRRVMAMLFMGFASGLPFGVLAEPLSAWLAESSVTKTAIGLFALVSLPYSLKFLWAPLMDNARAPLLGRWLGRRRGWLVITQALLIAAILGLGLTDPARDPWWTAALAFGVAFFSASQDIVFDAYRVELLGIEKQAAGAATAVFGWRLGQVGGGAAGLVAADLMPWPMVFFGMAALVAVGTVAVLLNPEPAPPADPEAAQRERRVDAFLEARSHLPHGLALFLARLYGAVIGPFADFVKRPGWLAILLFVMLYKFGDALLALMKVPFFLDLGFTKTEIAEVVKIFGFNAIIAGGFLGGVVLVRWGLMRGLVICGVLMALAHLLFIVQAWVGHDLWVLAATIALDNIAIGMGSTAFVAYLSSLCNVAYTATQYALLTSFMAFSRTVLSSSAGWMAEHLGWIGFFVATTVAALPGLALLVWMIRRYPPR